jgi:hypothetical protein
MKGPEMEYRLFVMLLPPLAALNTENLDVIEIS